MREKILPVNHLSSDVPVADYSQHLAVDIEESPESRRPALMSGGIIERPSSRRKRQQYFTWTQVEARRHRSSPQPSDYIELIMSMLVLSITAAFSPSKIIWPYLVQETLQVDP